MKRNKTFFTVVILAISMFALWGCPKKAEISSVPEAQESARARGEAEAEAEARARAREREAANRVKDAETNERAAAAAAGLRPVYFDFDQSHLRDDARKVMKANAEWLRANPKVKVRIEGHCDERGTIEYNQALGQRRSLSAKKYLTVLGISAGRISLLSYGKEKPACSDSDEECWKMNRRADFSRGE